MQAAMWLNANKDDVNMLWLEHFVASEIHVETSSSMQQYADVAVGGDWATELCPHKSD
jgi:hypothetical protein